jgi:molybdate transport system substrate-binding protein
MTQRFLWLILLSTYCLLSSCSSDRDDQEAPRLQLFVGAASQPATEEILAAFEAETGIEVDAIYGGSGYVLSQMKLARQGDIYFPGSSDYMEIAKASGDVLPETERIVAYLVPAINVAAGNPKHIQTLQDLTQPGLRVAIANPEGVCVGAYAVEIIEANLSATEKLAFRRNVVTYTESCAKTATAISLKAVDAVLGWRVFQYWDSTRIETVPLPAAAIQRIGYIPIAVSRYSQHPASAQRFIDYITSPQGQQVFERYRYFASTQAAHQWIGAEKPIGGTYDVPESWLSHQPSPLP